MMKIIVPERIYSIAPLLDGPGQSRFLSFVLGHDIDPAFSRGCPRFLGDYSDNMLRRCVKNLLRGIQPQSIQMELLDPISRISRKEFSHRAAVIAVKI